VHPGNANEIVKQWLDVHQLPSAPMAEGVVDGHPRQVWWDSDGETVVESYTITDMAHGTPLGMADNDNYYGSRGAFLIEAGISSSYHIAKFFGLTAWIRDSKKAEPRLPVADSPSAKLIPSVSPLPALPIPLPDLTKVLAPLANIAARPEPKAVAKGKKADSKKTGQPRRRAIDLSAIITRALTAAGLRKR
jgi:hypothetical protein